MPPRAPPAPAWAAWRGLSPARRCPRGRHWRRGSAAGRVAYEAFHAALEAAVGGEASAWRRQLVLGPAPEYCVLAAAERELPGEAGPDWPLRTVVAPLSG